MITMGNFIRAIKDTNLDFHCMGILAFLAFKADGMSSYITEMEDNSGSSATTIKKSLSILENSGYIERKYRKNRVYYRFIDRVPNKLKTVN